MLTHVLRSDCSTTGENPKWWGTGPMFYPSAARMWGEHRLPTPFSLPQWGDLGSVTGLGTVTLRTCQVRALFCRRHDNPTYYHCHRLANRHCDLERQCLAMNHQATKSKPAEAGFPRATSTPFASPVR